MTGSRLRRHSAQTAASLCAAALLAACGGGTPAVDRAAIPSATVTVPTAVPPDRPVDKLLVFVVENHSLEQMRQQMPETFALAQRFGYADDYQALAHPSLPNYIALASGGLQGVDNDAPPSRYQLTGHTVFGRALDAGRTSAAYLDGMAQPCQQIDEGRYAVRHNPWAYFVEERSQCERFDRPLAAFQQAVTAGTLPDAGLVAPDLCHDAHDCSLGVADAWIAGQVQRILDGPDWASGRLAVVITADEDEKHGVGDGDNRVLTVVLHPSLDGKVVHARLDHYALFELYEDVLGLPHERSEPVRPSMAQAFGLRLGR